MTSFLLFLLLFLIIANGGVVGYSEEKDKSDGNDKVPSSDSVAAAISKTIADARRHYSDSFDGQQCQTEIGNNDDQKACLHPGSEQQWPYDNVIVNDLEPFQDGITKSMLENAPLSRFGVVKYQIIGGRLYRSEKCGFPSRCAGIEHFLLELLREEHDTTILPDLEMIVNVSDYPIAIRKHVELGITPSIPIFSFSKTYAHLDIHYPAWTFWSGGPAIMPMYPLGMGRWDLARESMLQSGSDHPWDTKAKIGYFRGSRTSAERDPLILLSRRTNNGTTSLVDAAYTKNQSWRSNKDTLGEPPVEPVPMEEHCRYAYLFNFRGVAASFRFKYLFLCESLVINVVPPDGNDEWQEFFYYAMKPWVHYVPVPVGDRMAERVEELLHYFQSHEEEAKQIAKTGKEFILHHLRMEDIRLYWRRLLEKYAKLLDFTVVRDPILVEIVSS